MTGSKAHVFLKLIVWSYEKFKYRLNQHNMTRCVDGIQKTDGINSKKRGSDAPALINH